MVLENKKQVDSFQAEFYLSDVGNIFERSSKNKWYLLVENKGGQDDPHRRLEVSPARVEFNEYGERILYGIVSGKEIVGSGLERITKFDFS